MNDHQTAAEIAALHGVTRPTGYANSEPVFALRCPLLESKSGKSVHIWDGDGSYVAVNDHHPSCKNDSVADALNISRPGKGPRPPIRPRAKRKEAEAKPPLKPRPLPSGSPYWEPHVYHDATGNPVLAVVREDLGEDAEGVMAKTFWQFTPAPDAPDLWLPGGIRRDRPLYHLSKIPGDGPVVVVEGEKCVLAYESAWPDQTVTTFAGGSRCMAQDGLQTPARPRSLAAGRRRRLQPHGYA